MEGASGDKYRSYLAGDGEATTHWRHGAPPSYDAVNKLFEEGRTQQWLAGSLEETVQNAIKTWEMEFTHKTRLQDFKTINPKKFRLCVNGREGLSAEETLRMGSYNALLKSSVPEEKMLYRAEEESFESSHEGFRAAFPLGFAWEVMEVYSGPPVVVCKFRHWGYMEGAFQGHAATGELVQFIGMAVLKVDENLKVEEVEIYYDPGELFAGLLEGPLLSLEVGTHLHDQNYHADTNGDAIASKLQACPFFKDE